MTEALDRAATELANRFRIEPSDDLSEYRDAARAVLLTIREPTPEMLAEMLKAYLKSLPETQNLMTDMRLAWQAAIDEVLK